MPYQQQVFPPQSAAPKLSATPSASQDPAGGEEGTRGRSPSRGPQDRQCRNRSPTRASQKRRRGNPNDDLMDQMANYVASGWKRDLTHFIGCCWAAQVGSLERDEWHAAILKFLEVMTKRKASEWTDIKELTPLQFMPYVARLFLDVTGQDLQGLGQFTRWIGQGGYYHWRVAQLGKIHLVPHLQGQPMPRPPAVLPSGQPLPLRPARTGDSTYGISGKQSKKTQTAPGGGGQGSTPSQGSKTAATGGQPTTPHQGGQSASSSGSGRPATSGGSPLPPPGNRGCHHSLGATGATLNTRDASS